MTFSYNYNDIIEYEDGTRDLYFEGARKWASVNNATFDELIEERKEKEVEQEDGTIVKKLFRYFQINEIPEPEPYVPTDEEQRQYRANAYQQEVDPITSHISRLRDEEQTEEIVQEIEQLKEERSLKVQEIKERYPYSEQ